MAKYKPQHRRLLFISRKISEGRFPNCTSLAEEWEVSSKTIQRDLEYMRYELDAPIEYSAKERGYFYTEKNFQLPAISIKESDLFSIYLADEILEQYRDTPLYDRLKSIFDKIEGSLPSNPTNGYQLPQNRFSVMASPSTTVDPEIWDTIFTAVRNQETVQIEYRSPKGSVEKRKIDPYHTVRYDGDWYVIAHCHKRKDQRTFSLSRMRKAKLLEGHFTIPDGFDFNTISSGRFGIYWGQELEQVELEFSPAVAPYIRERIWHSSQKYNEGTNGSIKLSLTVNVNVELKKWILSWGKDVEVLAPEELRKEIKQEITELIGIYK